MTTVTRNADQTYGPTTRGAYYRQLPYHARTAAPRSDKSRWCILEPEEYGIFALAHDGEWVSHPGDNLFSLLANGRTVLGHDQERLGYFPAPGNKTDPWHGYPVHSWEKKPSPDLLDKWEREGVVDLSLRLKIERSKI